MAKPEFRNKNLDDATKDQLWGDAMEAFKLERLKYQNGTVMPDENFQPEEFDNDEFVTMSEDLLVPDPELTPNKD